MSTDDLSTARRYRWFIFGSLALGYVLVYFHRLCPAVVAEDMRLDLHASGGLVGLFASAYFYPYALMQLPAGLLSDSWGPRKTITLFFVVAFLGSLLLGTAHGVTSAIVGRTLVGLGMAMLFVPTMKVLAEWFQPREFAPMTGIFIAMGGIGSMTATSPLGLLSRAVGWRHSFLIIGFITLALAVLIWLIVRDRPADKGWPSPAGNHNHEEPPISLANGVIKVLSHGSFWPLALWFFFGCAVFFAFIGMWGGPYLQNLYGLDKTQAGNVLIFSAIGMVVGSPLLGLVSDRVLKARKPLIIIASAVTVALTAFLVLYFDRLSPNALRLFCFIMGIFTNAIVAIGFTATKELFPVRIAGTSTGLVNLFPFLGGAILQPVMGKILDHYGKVDNAFTVDGYRHAFLAMLVCAVLALVASFFVKETMARPGTDSSSPS